MSMSLIGALRPGQSQLDYGGTGVPDWTWGARRIWNPATNSWQADPSGGQTLFRRLSANPMDTSDEDVLWRLTQPRAPLAGHPDMTGAGFNRQQALSVLRDDYAKRGLNFEALRPDLAQELAHLGGASAYAGQGQAAYYHLTNPALAGQWLGNTNVTTPGTGPGAPIPGVNPTTGQPNTPAIPPAASPGGVQTPGQGNEIANEMLAADPEIAFRQGMIRAGYAPDRPGVLNSFIKSKFMPQFKDLFNVADLTQGNNFVPDINQFISNYWNNLRTGAGGGTRGMSQPMLQQLLGQGNQLEGDTALTPAEEMDLVAAASRLANTGAGNTYNRVLDRQRQAAENQFGDYVYNLAQTGQTQEDPFLTWLKRQSMWRRLVPQGQGY